MNRRDFLRSAAIATTGLALPRPRRLLADAPAADGLAHLRGDDTRRGLEAVRADAASGCRRRSSGDAVPEDALQHITPPRAARPSSSKTRPTRSGSSSRSSRPASRPVLTLTSRVSTKNYAVDLSGPRKGAARPTAAELEHCLRRDEDHADRRHRQGHRAPRSRRGREDRRREGARDLRVDRGQHVPQPKTRGCGVGDIRFMLESKDLGGKCADLNALYVGLGARRGLPARDVYGIRIVKSELGYKSLGAASETSRRRSTAARRSTSRATAGSRSIPPTCARSCSRSRPATARSTTRWSQKARARLFGSWEMNWMALQLRARRRAARLARARRRVLHVPQAETAEGRLDCLDPDNFKYEITSKESAASA